MKLILLARMFLIEKEIPMDDSVALKLVDDHTAIRVWDQVTESFDVIIYLDGAVTVTL